MADDPVPPSEGWQLWEAALALVPELARYVWDTDPSDQSLLDRLAVDVSRAIRARPDLQIVGRDDTRELDAPRVAVSRDIYESGAWLRLYLASGEVRIQRRGRGRDEWLTAVRVIAVPTASDARESAPVASGSALMLETLAEWYRDWAPHHPKASEADVLSAAKQAFAGSAITREQIRSLRKNPDGSQRRRGRIAGKSERDIAGRFRN